MLTGDQTRKYQRVSFGEKQVLIWLIKQRYLEQSDLAIIFHSRPQTQTKKKTHMLERKFVN